MTQQLKPDIFFVLVQNQRIYAFEFIYKTNKLHKLYEVCYAV